jgi:hypothetical protein
MACAWQGGCCTAMALNASGLVCGQHSAPAHVVVLIGCPSCLGTRQPSNPCRLGACGRAWSRACGRLPPPCPSIHLPPPSTMRGGNGPLRQQIRSPNLPGGFAPISKPGGKARRLYCRVQGDLSAYSLGSGHSMHLETCLQIHLKPARSYICEQQEHHKH